MFLREKKILDPNITQYHEDSYEVFGIYTILLIFYVLFLIYVHLVNVENHGGINILDFHRIRLRELGNLRRLNIRMR